MKFTIQLTCAACSKSVTVELRDLGDESRLRCPSCGRAVPVDPEQTWRLLRRLREEIRKVAGGGYEPRWRPKGCRASEEQAEKNSGRRRLQAFFKAL